LEIFFSIFRGRGTLKCESLLLRFYHYPRQQHLQGEGRSLESEGGGEERSWGNSEVISGGGNSYFKGTGNPEVKICRYEEGSGSWQSSGVPGNTRLGGGEDPGRTEAESTFWHERAPQKGRLRNYVLKG